MPVRGFRGIDPKREEGVKMIQKKRKKRYWLVGLVALLALGVAAFDVRLKTVFYSVRTSKVTQPLTIGVVADLHSCDYGKNQEKLTAAIAATKPDVLLLAGDIIDDDLPEEKAKEFLSWAGSHYPTYYVTGNHEYWTKEIDRLREMVRSYGITVLEGDTDLPEINGQRIQIAGINDPEAPAGEWEKELNRCGKERDKDMFSVLLTHRPEGINNYLPYGFDLVVAGHAHGGQWRVPGLINGVFAPNQGLFPRYAGGRYDFENTVMIVSRGLARESTRIPRIFNRPEYVVIKVEPEE